MDRQLPSGLEPGLQRTSDAFRTGHGSNVAVTGGQSEQQNHTRREHNCYALANDGFKHLQAHVATAAFDSGQDVDAPKCHPNTRTAVLDDIMKWILAVTRIQWILWLNGAAGAGKSAIGRSTVDLCLQQDILIVRFFFFRTDPTRNNISSLVATLVHQLLHIIPALTEIIVPKIECDPLIFNKSLETQFEYLIFGPLRQLRSQSLFQQTLVFLFDGLDECTRKVDQIALIRVVSGFVGTTVFPVLAFFGSRAESQISETFRSVDISPTVHSLTLDNHYLPDDDIRLFLNNSFSIIKNTHQFGRLIDSDWPSKTDVKEIVDKSSGQFIYASVVERFISMSNQHPAKQLEIVRGLRPPGKLTPFAQLDALYLHIFSQIDDFEFTSLALAWLIVHPDGVSSDLIMPELDMHVALAALPSVITYDVGDEEFKFLHASLPDFLLDQKRSRCFYIDLLTWRTQLAILAFQSAGKQGIYGQNYSIIAYLVSYFKDCPRRCSLELKQAAILLDPDRPEDKLPRYRISCIGIFCEYVQALREMDFGDGPGGMLYTLQLDILRHYLWLAFPLQENSNELANTRYPYVSVILDSIILAKESQRAQFITRLPRPIKKSDGLLDFKQRACVVPGTLSDTAQKKESDRALFKSRLPRLVRN